MNSTDEFIETVTEWITFSNLNRLNHIIAEARWLVAVDRYDFQCLYLTDPNSGSEMVVLEAVGKDNKIVITFFRDTQECDVVETVTTRRSL